MMRQLNLNDPNVLMLELVAQRLGSDLCSKFAFVGGAVVGLLITDPANPPIRATRDVDIVAEVLALSGYRRIEKALRERGFTQDMRADAPICRWQVDGITVDVMPTIEEVLGFANRWYRLCSDSGTSGFAQSGRHPPYSSPRLYRYQVGGIPWARGWRLFV
jgi:hypothetical protein